MTRMTAITDKSGRLLGALRTGPIQVGKDTIHVVARPHPDQIHHEIDLDDNELAQPIEALRRSVQRRIKA